MKDRLLHRPLYLRGFWDGDKLEFDSAGKPKQNLKAKPLTLSGIDVTSVDMDGRKLFLRAQRVALVADQDGRLQRETVISSRTHIFGSLMPGDRKDFKANEEMTLTVDADENGSFDNALHAIFADGLEDLSTSVPPYWTCYAKGYFAVAQSLEEAQAAVRKCVEDGSFAHRLGTNTGAADFVPPKLVRLAQSPVTHEAAELKVRGESEVSFSVSKHGIPVGFQILRAVGAGLDEATASAVSRSLFQPGTIAGEPVVADSVVEIRYDVGSQ